MSVTCISRLDDLVEAVGQQTPRESPIMVPGGQRSCRARYTARRGRGPGRVRLDADVISLAADNRHKASRP
jgi:hypothetical protein